MKDFKYCIWVCLDDKHALNDFCFTGRNGIFVCVDSEIKTLDEARMKFNNLKKKKIKIHIDSAPLQGRFGDLSVLYYKASSLNYCPYLYNADMIFGLSHPFERKSYKEEIYYITRAIGMSQEPSIVLSTFKLVKATGDYKYHWLVVDEYKACN